MSTDLHDRTRQPPPDEGSGKPDPPKSSISIAQVIGGALAAMTAAALGSRLSVAGTVVGAAFASIIAAVAGSIYTSSLRRTSRHVGTVLAKVRPGTPAAPGAPGTATSPVADPGTDASDTWVLPTTGSSPGDAADGAATTPPARRRIGWKTVLVAALLMFAVAAVSLTGIELLTGRALSGGTGTTVGQVADPATRPSATPSERSTPTPSVTPSASATAEPTTSAEPSATASSAPSSEPTAEPTPTPSQSAVPSATATPTPSSAPSAAGGSAGPTPAT